MPHRGFFIACPGNRLAMPPTEPATLSPSAELVRYATHLLEYPRKFAQRKFRQNMPEIVNRNDPAPDVHQMRLYTGGSAPEPMHRHQSVAQNRRH